jgi:glycerophosphoryl diester phosphodiesterase
VAQHAANLWRGAAVQPLLTSFKPEALRGARSASAELPRGLLLDSLRTSWLETALELGCVAIVCNYSLWDNTTVALAKNAGLRTLSYTVNDERAAQQLIDLGTDDIITDRVDLFLPAS